MTRQETFAKYLLFKNCKEVIPSRSRKYRQFTTPKGKTYWLGRQGAIRKGRTISNSISLTGFANYRMITDIVNKQKTNKQNTKAQAEEEVQKAVLAFCKNQ